MGDLKRQLDAHDTRLRALSAGPRIPIPGDTSWHSSLVVIVRDLLTEYDPVGRVEKAEQRAQRAVAEEWGSKAVAFYAQQARDERRLFDLWQRLGTLSPANATDLYNLILLAAFDKEHPNMIALYLHISCNELRLWATSTGQYAGHESRYSDRLFEHLDNEAPETGESERE
jgi:hypothetical protein